MTTRLESMPLAIYNPALLPPDVLLGEFTARRTLLRRLLDTVRGNDEGQPPQHVLLIGPRGIGKTTTLWAVAHSIARDEILATSWQPVVFDEESRRVGDLADFWLESIRQWEHAVNDERGRAERLLELGGGTVEEKAKEEFLGLVDASGKRALLLIDNLNELFLAMPEEGLHRMREFLMKDSRVMLIGAATRYFEDVTGVDRPFFDFFRIYELHPLTLEEMKDTLLVLAERRSDPKVKVEIEQRPGTLQALHLLTGGNPRLVKTFYRMLAEGMRGDIRTELEVLLDDFTPYFKSILDALPAQQQRVLDAVAIAWDPVEVAAIAKATRLPSNQVSAQLRALGRAGIITEASGNQKRKAYLLADRFSNIHYLMRHGRVARRRFDWFVLLVQALFPDSDEQMLARVVNRTVAAGDEGVADARELLASALSFARDEGRGKKMVDATVKELWSGETLRCLTQLFDEETRRKHFGEGEVELLRLFASVPGELRKEVGYKPQDPKWWCDIGRSLAKAKAFELVERCLRKAIELDPKYARPWNNFGNHLLESKRLVEAEAAYRKAIELDPNYAFPWNNLGNLLLESKRLVEAEVAFRKAIELDPKYAFPRNNLGNLLRNTKRLEEAEAAYRKAVELDPKYARPWHNLGILLRKTKRLEEAEAAFRKAIELRPKYALSWYNLGSLLHDSKRLGEAEVAFRKAIELDPKYATPWNDLGNLLGKSKRLEEAGDAYRKAIELDPKYAFPWNNLGNLLRELERLEESEAAYRKAIDLDPKYATPWNNLGGLLDDLKRPEEAEAASRKAIDLDPKYASPWNNLGTFLQNTHRLEEAEAAYRKAIELDQKFAKAKANLATLLVSGAVRNDEASKLAIEALKIDSSDPFIEDVFLNVCGEDATAWREILPLIADLAMEDADSGRGLFEFAVEGFVRLAALDSAKGALKIMGAVADSIPFETLKDAFRAEQDKEHLEKLAPERRALAIQIRKRIAARRIKHGR